MRYMVALSLALLVSLVVAETAMAKKAPAEDQVLNMERPSGGYQSCSAVARR